MKLYSQETYKNALYAHDGWQFEGFEISHCFKVVVMQNVLSWVSNGRSPLRSKELRNAFGGERERVRKRTQMRSLVRMFMSGTALSDTYRNVPVQYVVWMGRLVREIPNEVRKDSFVQSPEGSSTEFQHLRLVYTYDASTTISTSMSHVWTGTTQAQAQEKGTRACACVVPVHTWLMLVLASSRFTRGLCLCLRRPGSHVAYACACACVVPVHTWLMLVLASSRFTRGLCLCLRRTCKPAFTE